MEQLKAGEEDPEVKRKFYLDINAHVPITRLRRNITPAEHIAVQSNSLLANYLIHINPSSSNSNSIIKRARFCPIFVSVNTLSRATKRSMPVSINDFLPSFNLHLGLLEDEENTMRMLVDTGAAMNSGNLAYHLWVMFECSEMVGESIQCGGTSDYDVVKLLAPLDLDTS